MGDKARFRTLDSWILQQSYTTFIYVKLKPLQNFLKIL